jgi:hypothetical protein
MRFTASSAPSIKSLEDRFYCRVKRRAVMFANCLDDYVTATSLEKRGRACYRCPHGRRNRESYAFVGDAD